MFRRIRILGWLFLGLWGIGCSNTPRKPSDQKIKELFRARACTNCHDIHNAFGGPSFVMIAERYPYDRKNVETLSKRVRQGTRGRWKGLPLTECPPKSDKIPEYEIQWMIEWILKRSWEKSL